MWVEWVEGELAGLKLAPSGHAYFQLKDEREDALLDCVMYKFYAARARRFLSEGARVQLSGRATINAARGRLQFVAEALRPAGRGALLEALEQLKQRLLAEGLFDPARKRPLPPDPRVVGVVTSRSGAALHDITSVAFRRANVTVVLAAALVQGEDAPRSIVRALDKLDRFPGLDVVILGRGGGSAEDLMPFNDERVVRRVASMKVPVVSAVGHEVDISLTDFVADVRAATPSQAAEMVVPDRRSRVRALDDQMRHLGRAMHTRLLEAQAEADRLRTKIGDPRFYLAEKQQQLDETRLDLERALVRRIRDRRQVLERLHRRVLLQHPSRRDFAGARRDRADERAAYRCHACSLGRLASVARRAGDQHRGAFAAGRARARLRDCRGPRGQGREGRSVAQRWATHHTPTPAR